MADIKAGDKINVSYRGEYDWVPEMDYFIGRRLTVSEATLEENGVIRMVVVETGWRFYNDACEKIGEDGKMQVIDGIAQ